MSGWRSQQHAEAGRALVPRQFCAKVNQASVRGHLLLPRHLQQHRSHQLVRHPGGAEVRRYVFLKEIFLAQLLINFQYTKRRSLTKKFIKL